MPQHYIHSPGVNLTGQYSRVHVGGRQLETSAGGFPNEATSSRVHVGGRPLETNTGGFPNEATHSRVHVGGRPLEKSAGGFPNEATPYRGGYGGSQQFNTLESAGGQPSRAGSGGLQPPGGHYPGK